MLKVIQEVDPQEISAAVTVPPVVTEKFVPAMAFSPIFMALTISASATLIASVIAPPVAPVIISPFAIVPVASRFSKIRSCVGKAVSRPSNLEIETVEVESTAISISKLESVVVFAKTISMSLASDVVIVLPEDASYAA